MYSLLRHLTTFTCALTLTTTASKLPKNRLFSSIPRNMASFEGAPVPNTDESPIMKGGEADKAADFANYFCTYGYLYHQKQMLMDHVRMHSYHSAIMRNKHLFEGKVVLDVGTGSGALSIWCAQAGAAKVFACEYTDMAKHARALVEKNGLSHIVEVMQCSAEELDLPCKVDIIISEWMGYFLLRESMLDSVIRARNKWLKDGGSMFPSYATMYWSAVTYEDDREVKTREYNDSLNEWEKFSDEMKEYYKIDMTGLTTTYKKEQEDYFLYSSLWTELNSSHVVGQPVVIKRMDLNKCSVADAENIMKAPFDITIPFPITMSGFAGWFTVDFAGSVENPCEHRVNLSTGPEVGYTHWGQQVFYLPKAIHCQTDTKITGEMSMVRQEKNKRLYNVELEFQVDDGAGEDDKFKGKYEIP